MELSDDQEYFSRPRILWLRCVQFGTMNYLCPVSCDVAVPWTFVPPVMQSIGRWSRIEYRVPEPEKVKRYNHKTMSLFLQQLRGSPVSIEFSENCRSILHKTCHWLGHSGLLNYSCSICKRWTNKQQKDTILPKMFTEIIFLVQFCGMIAPSPLFVKFN